MSSGAWIELPSTYLYVLAMSAFLAGWTARTVGSYAAKWGRSFYHQWTSSRTAKPAPYEGLKLVSAPDTASASKLQTNAHRP
jgi:hypothetical protein